MANQWFRMYHEFATDPKVQMLSEADQRRFIMILCLKCSNGDVTLHDNEVAFQLRISNEELAATKTVLVERGLIKEDFSPVSWAKRQFVSDSSAARVSRHRERKKQQEKECNVTVTPPDTDTDTDTDTEKRAAPGGAACESPPKKTIPYAKILAAYHEICPNFPAVHKLSPSRKSHVRQRHLAEMEESLEVWQAYFRSVLGSPFLSGRTSHNFKCTFDWLINESNSLKIIEGNYHDKNQQRNTAETGRKLTPAERVRARHAEIYGVESTEESPPLDTVVAIQ